METNTTPEHKQVFLNELHETLKRLDPRRVHSAGYYRILGRLVEYDMEEQLVKIESCFHDEYMSQPIVVPPGPRTTATRRKKKDLYRSSSTPEPQLKPGVGSHGNGNSNNKSTAIDLVTDSEDEEETVKPATSTTDQQQQAGVSAKKRVELIVLSDDEEDPVPLPADVKEDECNGQERLDTILDSTKPRRAPKVILWVDTQLLSARAFEKHALYQFMGEVVYSTSISTTSTSSSVDVDRNSGRREGRGHWVLEARSARLMEGLDLWSYRQGILLTRDLIVQYEQQAREREREREERDRAEWEKEVEMMTME